MIAAWGAYQDSYFPGFEACTMHLAGKDAFYIDGMLNEASFLILVE